VTALCGAPAQRALTPPKEQASLTSSVGLIPPCVRLVPQIINSGYSHQIQCLQLQVIISSWLVVAFGGTFITVNTWMLFWRAGQDRLRDIQDLQFDFVHIIVKVLIKIEGCFGGLFQISLVSFKKITYLGFFLF